MALVVPCVAHTSCESSSIVNGSRSCSCVTPWTGSTCTSAPSGCDSNDVNAVSNMNAVYSILGVPFWWERNSPRTILQPGASPGQCWAFKGSHGSVVVRLSSPVRVSAVTVEHIPSMVSPDQTISSAPKTFSVLGLRRLDDDNPFVLGNFTYKDDNNPVQTFFVDTTFSEPLELVELKVLSNHGHPVYTCLYRFRVHGTLPAKV